MVLNVVVFQGDMEKSLGWQPIPLYDKKYAAEVPAMQVLDVVITLFLVSNVQIMVTIKLSIAKTKSKI